MKKTTVLFALLVVGLLLTACGGTPQQNGLEDAPPPATQEPVQTEPPAPEPELQPKSDYSMSTTMPDGSERVEGTYLGKGEGETILVESVGGERTIKISPTVADHIEKLEIKEQDVVILVLKEGVAESVEKVVS